MEDLLKQILDEFKILNEQINIIESFCLGNLINEPVPSNVKFPESIYDP